MGVYFSRKCFPEEETLKKDSHLKHHRGLSVIGADKPLEFRKFKECSRILIYFNV